MLEHAQMADQKYLNDSDISRPKTITKWLKITVKTILLISSPNISLKLLSLEILFLKYQYKETLILHF